MDQNKTNIPNISPTPKALQTTFRLQTHGTGILAHTRSPRGRRHMQYMIFASGLKMLTSPFMLYVFGFCAFLVESQIFRKVSHSSVIICTSNCSYYMRHSYLSINYSACGHYRVYMCTQLCAFFYSHTVLYFLLSCLLLLLLYASLILKVSVNFLPVGHTHEDVDQFLRKTGCVW